MIIKTLKLIDFGKFKNKQIELMDGLNIIYGENEAGKTTIHNFIDGMFYGFLKAHVKSKIYTPEHNKYKPWHSNSYKGILRLNSNEVGYRIERIFEKGNESLRVLLEDTGEDVTNKINNGHNSRVLQPGNEFFGISNGVYSNTVSIKQLESKTEDSLANELRDKLINLSNTNDDKISIDNAIKDIEKSLKEIGTIKAPTSIYGSLANAIDRLKNEKYGIIKLKGEYEALIESKNEIDYKLVDLNNQMSIEKQDLDNAVKMEKVKTYYELRDISNTMKVLKGQLDELVIYKDLSNDDYSEALDISNEIKIISSKIEDLESQIREVEEIIKDIFLNKDDLDSKKVDEVFYDYLTYTKLEEEKNKLIYTENNINLDFLKEDYNQTKHTVSLYILIIGIIAVTYLSGLYYSYRISSIMLGLILQILIIPAGVFIQKSRRYKHLLERINTQTKEYESQIVASNASIKEKEAVERSILDKYGLTSKLELKALYEQYQEKKFILDEQIRSLDKNKDKLSILNNRMIEMDLKKKENISQLELLLINNGVESLDKFKNGLEFKNTYEDTLIHYNSKRELFNKILGQSSLEEFKTYADENTIDFDLETKDVVEDRIEILQDEIQNTLLEKKGIDERINYLTPRVSKLVDIDEEITRNTNKLKDLDRRRESLDLAKSTLEELSKNIHNQFAPEINDRVGEIISTITGGKYIDVKIDNKLNMGIISPNTGQIIGIDSLSGGTLDQLYFSLRFGIITSITERNVPLILDDCFIQYDDNRLENILELLEKISKARQVILFTCQKREQNILDNMKASYKLINLT